MGDIADMVLEGILSEDGEFIGEEHVDETVAPPVKHGRRWMKNRRKRQRRKAKIAAAKRPGPVDA
jgi:hypothetical protein